MIRYIFIISFLTIAALKADDISALAKELGLFAGTKATVQWERVFSSQRRMMEYKLDVIPLHQINELKNYLIAHAADSNQPVVPGL